MPGPLDDKPVKLLRKKLDDAGVEAHLAALAADARSIEVRIKGAATAYSEASTTALDDAGRRLRAGEIAAVQIRFFLDDDWWCDTVMRAGDSYRLVRMRLSQPA